VFRRNIGRRERVAPGQATVDYIRERLEVAWVVLPQSEIAILERDLIAKCAIQWDLYNLSGNPLALQGGKPQGSRHAASRAP
jgi:hypothetical protein